MTPLGKKNVVVILLILFIGIVALSVAVDNSNKKKVPDKFREAVELAIRKSAPLLSKPHSSHSSELPYRISDCESGHWIDAVMNEGKIIKLEDGSVWEVDDTDTVDSSLWLSMSDVVLCDDKIVNVDEGETVSATQLR